MTLDSWITRLAAANTDEHVLAVVRDFLASLPAGFQPPEMLSAQDVSSYAFVLMHRSIVKDCDPALLGMNRFFAAASQRVSIILTPRDQFTPRPQFDAG